MSAALILGAIDPTIGALAIAVVASLGAYLAAVRRFSGKIASSDASELWEESRSIRQWSHDRIAELEERVAVCERRHDGLARENNALVGEVRGLRGEIVALTAELRTANARVIELEEAGSHGD